MKKITIAILTIGLITGCSSDADEGVSEKQSSSSSVVSSSSSSQVRETNNVTYKGTIKVLDTSVYKQGTHRLELEDGRFIFLEGNGIDINGYVGERAEVFGSIRPTQQEGGMIMRVERVQLDETESSSSSQDQSSSPSSLDSSSSSSSNNSSAMSSSSEESLSSSSAVSSSSEESSSSQETTSSSSEEVLLEVDKSSESSSSSMQSNFDSPAVQARIEVMAKEDVSLDRWTQEYCSSHIEFCIPVHKNWWFTSFGNTDSSLWRVELSSEQIEFIGDGPIVIMLLPGDISETGMSDGQVVESNGNIIAYKEWLYGRHFEIIADASLRTSVEIIANGLTSSEQQ